MEETTFHHVNPLTSFSRGPRLTLSTVYPLIYHSIADEIPEVSRPLITRLFQLWLVLGATLLFNMVACIINFAVGAKDGGSLGSSIGCAALDTPRPPVVVLTPLKGTSSSSRRSPSCCGTGKLFSLLPLATAR